MDSGSMKKRPAGCPASRATCGARLHLAPHRRLDRDDRSGAAAVRDRHAARLGRRASASSRAWPRAPHRCCGSSRAGSPTASGAASRSCSWATGSRPRPRAALALARSWPAVLGLRFSDRVGKGLRNPPRDALIADSVAPAAAAARSGSTARSTRWVRRSARWRPSRCCAPGRASSGACSCLRVPARSRWWCSRPSCARRARRRRAGRAPAAEFRGLGGAGQALPARGRGVPARHEQHGVRAAAGRARRGSRRAGAAGLHALQPGLRALCLAARAALGPHRPAPAPARRLPALRRRSTRCWPGSADAVGGAGALAVLGVHSALLEVSQRSMLADLVAPSGAAPPTGSTTPWWAWRCCRPASSAGGCGTASGPRATFGVGAALALLAALLFALLLPARTRGGSPCPLRELGEFEVIRRLTRPATRSPRRRGGRVVVGAATTRRCCAPSPGDDLVATTDALVEGATSCPPGARRGGRRAAGGRQPERHRGDGRPPRWALLSIGVRPDHDVGRVARVPGGLAEALRETARRWWAATWRRWTARSGRLTLLGVAPAGGCGRATARAPATCSR